MIKKMLALFVLLLSSCTTLGVAANGSADASGSATGTATGTLDETRTDTSAEAQTTTVNDGSALANAEAEAAVSGDNVAAGGAAGAVSDSVTADSPVGSVGIAGYIGAAVTVGIAYEGEATVDVSALAATSTDNADSGVSIGGSISVNGLNGPQAECNSGFISKYVVNR